MLVYQSLSGWSSTKNSFSWQEKFLGGLIRKEQKKAIKMIKNRKGKVVTDISGMYKCLKNTTEIWTKQK